MGLFSFSMTPAGRGLEDTFVRITTNGRGQHQQPKLKSTFADVVRIRVVDENTRFLSAMADLYKSGADDRSGENARDLESGTNRYIQRKERSQ